MVIYMRFMGCDIYPGVAKFGIALDWGSRGRRFKSCHSDQLALTKKMQAKIPHFGAGFLY